MELNRRLTKKEVELLSILISLSTEIIPSDWTDNLLANPLANGEMGGLLLHPTGESNEFRKFGKQVSEYCFDEIDNITVIASLYLDQNSELFELDIWKTDFSTVKCLKSV